MVRARGFFGWPSRTVGEGRKIANRISGAERAGRLMLKGDLGVKSAESGQTVAVTQSEIPEAIHSAGHQLQRRERFKLGG